MDRLLGFIALIKIRKNSLGGKWLAVTGIVISAIIVIVMVIFGFMTSWGASS